MMTMKRFRALADSYGADLQRWPEQMRPQARALLDSSAEAQDIVARARRVDEAIAAAGAERSGRLWSGDRPEAALVRLRNNVAARIRPAAATPAARGIRARTPRGARHRMGWLGLATAASVAIVAGIALGALYLPSTSQQDLLALLQPSPIQLPGD
jgi:hypothetical protein